MSALSLDMVSVNESMLALQQNLLRINNQFKEWIVAKKTDMAAQRCMATFSFKLVAIKWLDVETKKFSLVTKALDECYIPSNSFQFYKNESTIKIDNPDSLEALDFTKEMDKVIDFLKTSNKDFALKLSLEASFSSGIGFSSYLRKVIHPVEQHFETVEAKLEEVDELFTISK